MPPRFKFTKDEIIASATRLVEEEGIGGLTARKLGDKMGTSSKPIFGLFSSMDEVKRGVIERAKEKYIECVDLEMQRYKDIPYKAYGMGYIRFARDHRELFRLLYMRDRTDEDASLDKEELKPLLELIASKTGLDIDDAYIFHLEIWLFVHGVATTIVTSYAKWDWDFIDKIVTDQFKNLKSTFLLGGKNEGNNNGKSNEKI